jgi:hypothetical protein
LVEAEEEERSGEDWEVGMGGAGGSTSISDRFWGKVKELC